jgi:hypothetical protein
MFAQIDITHCILDVEPRSGCALTLVSYQFDQCFVSFAAN